MGKRLQPVSLQQVSFGDGFWGQRIAVNREVTLKVQHAQSASRIEAFKLDWKPGQPDPPHQFWDSDVAKWIEASAYSLATHPDADLEAKVDAAVDLIAAAQQPDGYLNTHYTVVEPEKRWTDLKDGHELYCAGHLMEAAVAYAEATGKKKLLYTLCKYADHIDAQFGREDGKRRGYCGHPEIELALMKLAVSTGEPRYAKLAQYMVDERGRQPHLFDQERAARGEKVSAEKGWHDLAERDDHYSAHRPFVQQKVITGHAVRALYLLAGAVDVAAALGDKKLLAACRRLFDSAARRRMYVTGAVGSRRHGETFTFDYDLPNETAYAETCATISLCFVAHRLLQIEPNGEYADVIERALYNGVISGVSLSGDRFRYANPLTVHAEALSPNMHPFLRAARQEWFGCSCCPPNVARVLASLGQYAYSTTDDALFVHLYAAGEVNVEIAGVAVKVTQATEYPWKEKIAFAVAPAKPTSFTIAVRIPGWCRRAKLTINGKAVKFKPQADYAMLKRRWTAGDRIELTLPMPIERVHAHPEVRADAGKVALQRGPVVYCFEETDNGPRLANLVLPAKAKLKASWKPKLLGGVVTIKTTGLRSETSDAALYTANPAATTRVKLRAVPYCVWGNRKIGEMLVWIREA